MTTETVDKPAEVAGSEMDKLNAQLAEVQTAQAEAMAGWQNMVASGAKGMDYAAQLAVAQAMTDANKRIEAIEAKIKLESGRAEREAKSAAAKAAADKLAALKPVIDALDNSVKQVVERSRIFRLMRENAVDGAVTFTVSCKVEEDGSETLEVVTRMPKGASVPRASSGGNGGGNGRKTFIADGVEYGSTAYLEKFLPDAMDKGLVKWGSFEERMAFVKDHATRATRLAEILGHEVTKAEAASE